MNRVERVIEMDPCAEWEGRLLLLLRYVSSNHAIWRHIGQNPRRAVRMCCSSRLARRRVHPELPLTWNPSGDRGTRTLSLGCWPRLAPLEPSAKQILETADERLISQKAASSRVPTNLRAIAILDRESCPPILNLSERSRGSHERILSSDEVERVSVVVRQGGRPSRRLRLGPWRTADRPRRRVRHGDCYDRIPVLPGAQRQVAEAREGDDRSGRPVRRFLVVGAVGSESDETGLRGGAPHDAAECQENHEQRPAPGASRHRLKTTLGFGWSMSCSPGYGSARRGGRGIRTDVVRLYAS